ncbi:hypothetical protein CC86DRAFT_399911 [Ophiobolus disseminans]|uniref:Uncharacterized protein n=1 Tax=Ophiobolus disseminans TaxID=1469910 RepID=A0A6A7AKS7_9PLEO|nr:hypothetical protein CC86DRAFT_399911 [Ophiobolus disseminans]
MITFDIHAEELDQHKFNDEGYSTMIGHTCLDSTETDLQTRPLRISPSSSTSSSAVEDDHAVLVAKKADGLSCSTQNDNDLLCVPLEDDFVDSLCWSNDPGHLALETYFDPKKPSLAGDFQVDGLRPVIREDHDRHRFILMDNKNRFYVWTEWDGRLFWVRHAEIEHLTTVEEKVEFILGTLGYLEVEPVYHTKHPADDPELETIRKAFPKYRI